MPPLSVRSIRNFNPVRRSPVLVVQKYIKEMSNIAPRAYIFGQQLRGEWLAFHCLCCVCDYVPSSFALIFTPRARSRRYLSTANYLICNLRKTYLVICLMLSNVISYYFVNIREFEFILNSQQFQLIKKVLLYLR